MADAGDGASSSGKSSKKVTKAEKKNEKNSKKVAEAKKKARGKGNKPEKPKKLDKRSFNHAQLSIVDPDFLATLQSANDSYTSSWNEKNNYISDLVHEQLYPWTKESAAVEEWQLKSADRVHEVALRVYGGSEKFKREIREVQQHTHSLPIRKQDGRIVGAGEIDEDDVHSKKNLPGHGQFFDGLKRFRLEWEPTQTIRLPELPRLISGAEFGENRKKVRGMTNWRVVIPLKLKTHCQQLMQHETIKKGLLGLLSLPDTEMTRHLMISELIDPAHLEGCKTPMGTTPLQCVMTLARWTVLGHLEANPVPEPEGYQISWKSILNKDKSMMYEHGKQNELFALVMDLLTRLLSANPTVYERALLNTKGSRVLNKEKAMNICLDNNILEVLYKILEKPADFNTNGADRADPEFGKAVKQLSRLKAVHVKEKQNGTGKHWYAVNPSIAAEAEELNRKPTFVKAGYTPAQFGKDTAPTPPEMALCILRGLTTSYLRQEASSAVSTDRCAKIFLTQYGVIKGKSKSVMQKHRRGISDLIRAVVSWECNHGFGPTSNNSKIEWRPIRPHIGAPTRSDSWRILHNLMVTLEACRPDIGTEVYMQAKQCLTSVTIYIGQATKKVQPVNIVLEHWIWFLNHKNFSTLVGEQTQKLDLTAKHDGRTTSEMLTEADWYSIVDFSSLQLSRMILGIGSAAVDVAVVGTGSTKTLFNILTEFYQADDEYIFGLGQTSVEAVHYLSLHRSASCVMSALAIRADGGHLVALQQSAAAFKLVMSDSISCRAAFNERGFMTAIAYLYVFDAETERLGPEHDIMLNILRCYMDAFTYIRLRYQKNIVDDNHYVKPYLKPEKEIILPLPTAKHRKGLLSSKPKPLSSGSRTCRPNLGKIVHIPPESRSAYFAAVDMNGRYLEIHGVRDGVVRMEGWSIVARREINGRHVETAVFYFPRGSVLDSNRRRAPNRLRIWNPTTSRRYTECERLFAMSKDESHSELDQFDPSVDLTWIEEKNDAKADKYGFGASGTKRLDDYLSDEHIATAKAAVRQRVDKLTGQSQVELDDLPSLPYSALDFFHGCSFVLKTPENRTEDVAEFTGTPPIGSLSYQGSEVPKGTVEWYEHGMSTARTGTQWADPDHIKIGFQGTFLEPFFIFDACHRYAANPAMTAELLQIGTPGVVVGVLLDLRNMREERRNERFIATAFDVQAGQRRPDEDSALRLMSRLMSPLSGSVRGLFSIVDPSVLSEPEPFRFTDEFSRWATAVDLYRLFEHFEDEATVSSVTGAEAAAVAWMNHAIRENLLKLMSNGTLIPNLSPLESLASSQGAVGTRTMHVYISGQFRDGAVYVKPTKHKNLEVGTGEQIHDCLCKMVDALSKKQGYCMPSRSQKVRVRISEACRNRKFPFSAAVDEGAIIAAQTPGSEYRFCVSDISALVTTSSCFLAFLTQEYFESEYCRLELRLALMRKAQLVPVFPYGHRFTLKNIPSEFRNDIQNAGVMWEFDVAQFGEGFDFESSPIVQELHNFIEHPDPSRADLQYAIKTQVFSQSPPVVHAVVSPIKTSATPISPDEQKELISRLDAAADNVILPNEDEQIFELHRHENEEFGMTLSESPTSPEITISSIETGSIADQAGIRAGTLLSSIDGEQIITENTGMQKLAQFTSVIIVCQSKSPTGNPDSAPRRRATIVGASSVTLPEDWEMRLGDEGYYYVDSSEQIFTELPQGYDPPILPECWECRIDRTTNQRYFLDIRGNESHYELPPPMSPVPESKPDQQKDQNSSVHKEQPLEENWEVLVDPESGNTYYHHVFTNETKWERPVAVFNTVNLEDSVQPDAIQARSVSPLSDTMELDPLSTSPPWAQSNLNISATLTKLPGKGFGMSIANVEGMEGIFIVGIQPNSVASETGVLEVGMQILSINGDNIENVSRDVAITALRSSETVEILCSPSVPLGSPTEANSPLPPLPASPPFINDDNAVVVVIDRSPGEGFGMTVSNLEDEIGLFIVSIKQGSAASRTGQLSVGMRILSINGVNTESTSKEDAISIFKQSQSVRIECISGDPITDRTKSTGTMVSATLSRIEGQGFGMSIANHDDGYSKGIFIVSIRDGSIASQCGILTVGMRIVSINGILTGYDKSEPLALLKENSTVTLVCEPPRMSNSNADLKSELTSNKTNLTSALLAEDIALPNGWEARVDIDSGKRYYVDTISSDSHWNLPNGFESLQLPPSVECLIDKESYNRYFWDPVQEQRLVSIPLDPTRNIENSSRAEYSPEQLPTPSMLDYSPDRFIPAPSNSGILERSHTPLTVDYDSHIAIPASIPKGSNLQSSPIPFPADYSLEQSPEPNTFSPYDPANTSPPEPSTDYENMRIEVPSNAQVFPAQDTMSPGPESPAMLNKSVHDDWPISPPSSLGTVESVSDTHLANANFYEETVNRDKAIKSSSLVSERKLDSVSSTLQSRHLDTENDLEYHNWDPSLPDAVNEPEGLFIGGHASGKVASTVGAVDTLPNEEILHRTSAQNVHRYHNWNRDLTGGSESSATESNPNYESWPVPPPVVAKPPAPQKPEHLASKPATPAKPKHLATGSTSDNVNPVPPPFKPTPPLKPDNLSTATSKPKPPPPKKPVHLRAGGDTLEAENNSFFELMNSSSSDALAIDTDFTEQTADEEIAFMALMSDSNSNNDTLAPSDIEEPPTDEFDRVFLPNEGLTSESKTGVACEVTNPITEKSVNEFQTQQPRDRSATVWKKPQKPPKPTFSADMDSAVDQAKHRAADHIRKVAQEEMAAIKIQAGFRGMKGRRKYQAELEKSVSEEEAAIEAMVMEMEQEMENAVIKIQAGFRGMRTRKALAAAKEARQPKPQQQQEQLDDADEEAAIEAMVAEMEKEMENAVIKIQAGFRGMKARKAVANIRNESSL